MTDEQALTRLGQIRLAAASLEGVTGSLSCLWSGKAAYGGGLLAGSENTLGGVVGSFTKPARRMHAAPLGTALFPFALALSCDRSPKNQEGSP